MARLTKPHGLRGEITADVWSDVPDRFAVGTTFATTGGPAATLTVASVRAHQGRLLLTFDGVESREAAERLRGVELLAPHVPVEGALWVHELVGCRMVDTAGRELGTVAAVEPNPASDLLVLEGGALVPARFVVDHRPGVSVTVEVPEGLVEPGAG